MPFEIIYAWVTDLVFMSRGSAEFMRASVLVALGALHVAAIILLDHNERAGSARLSPSEQVTTAFIQPKIRARSEAAPGPDLSTLVWRVEPSLRSLQFELPIIDVSTSRNESARIAAPKLQEEPSLSMSSYLQQAALLPGEGATVVLRIEVLESGAPGRIEVDTSSGSAQIDQAAIDYARTRHWYAGQMNGSPHSMWIRWGVRLQA